MATLPDNRSLGSALPDSSEIKSNPMIRYCRGELRPGMDTLALEAPLNVFLGGEFVATTMRTPGADKDLAVGMLYCLGLIHSHDATGLSFESDGDSIHVACAKTPPPVVPHKPAKKAAKVLDDSELAENLLTMRETLERTQRLYRHTAATHCAMFFDTGENPVAFGEDVGRHNAFDKCVGRCLRKNTLHEAHYAVISSRLSHEIVKKAVAADIKILAGFSVATSIALDMARAHGITLVGRLRSDTMNLYSPEI